MADVRIQRGYQPGVIGRITQLHACYYHAEWHFGLYFEAKVATELSAFLTRYDPEHDGIWLAATQGGIEGSIVIDGSHGKDRGGSSAMVHHVGSFSRKGARPAAPP